MPGQRRNGPHAGIERTQRECASHRDHRGRQFLTY